MLPCHEHYIAIQNVLPEVCILSLHKSMQAGVGVQSYKTDDRDRFEIRLKFCPKCDIGTCTALV